MFRWKRMAAIACALPVAVAAQVAAPGTTDNFPTRATGNAGTAIAVEAAGEAERVFQTEKERQRAKAEEERKIREEAERKAAEEARIERERAEVERRANEEAERVAAAKAAADEAAAATAAAAAKTAATQAKIAETTSAAELFVLADELKSGGDIEGSRAALRALIARFPEHKFADMAVTMLTGQAVPGPAAPAPAPTPAAPAAAQVVAPPPPPAAPVPGACLAVLSQFSAARPPAPGGVSTAEREVFYGRYYERLLAAAPACRSDPATAQRIRDGIKRNLLACLQQPDANCTTGVPDVAISIVDAAYERVVTQSLVTATMTPPPPPGTEPKQ